MRDFIDESIGWYGAFVTILAYALVSFGYLQSSMFSYQILNIMGTFGLLYIAFKKKIYQSVATNVVWGAIAIIALVNILI